MRLHLPKIIKEIPINNFSPTTIIPLRATTMRYYYYSTKDS